MIQSLIFGNIIPLRNSYRTIAVNLTQHKPVTDGHVSISSCAWLILLTIFDEVFLKQWGNARRAAEAIGEAVGNNFCKFDSFLRIEALQELYQLHKE